MSDVSDNGYTGPEDPTVAHDPFNELSFLFDQLMNAKWTLTLGLVKSVSGGGVGASPPLLGVQPMVNQINGQSQPTAHGIINNVPAFRLGGGSGGIVVDPVVGDIGLLAIASSDISAIKQNKAPSNPGSFRTFSPSDAIYLGALLSAAPTQYVQITPQGITCKFADGISITLASTGITLQAGSASIVIANDGSITINGNAIIVGNLQLGGNIESEAGGTYPGNISTSGNVIAGFGGADQVGLSTHTHTQGVDSRGDTEEPTSAPTAGT